MNANILDAVIKSGRDQTVGRSPDPGDHRGIHYKHFVQEVEPENELEVYIDDAVRGIKVSLQMQSRRAGKRIGRDLIGRCPGEFDPHAQLGDYIQKEMSLHEFEPKLVITAQRIIQERIRNLEDEKIQNDFNKQKHTIVSERSSP